MAQDSWPDPARAGRSVTDAEFDVLSARNTDDGVYGSPADPAVAAAGVGLTVTIRAGVAASVRGRAWTSGSTAVSLPVPANTSSQARTDRVVLRLDRSAWTVRAVVKPGTPGSGAPSVTRDAGTTGLWEVPLGTVAVPAGATGVQVTRGEQYVGARTRPCTSTTRPLFPVVGEQAYETNTGRLLMWSGSAWITLYTPPTWADANAAVSGWSENVTAVVEMVSGSVHVRLGSWTRSGGTLANTTESRLPILIPAAFRHSTRTQYVSAYVNNARIARLTIHPANSDKPGQVWLTQKPEIRKGDYVMADSISWAAA
jgi:hypothetical protein